MPEMITRIPLSDFQLNIDKDVDLENAYKWVRTFISENEWGRRKKAVEEHLERAYKTNQLSTEPISQRAPLALERDQIGWYLYLVHVSLYEPHKTDYYQTARVLPIFKRLGMNLDLLHQIEGIGKKMRDLLRRRTSEADSFLFEILTALVWKRNGWDVKIIEEGKSGKTPDFAVSKGKQHWQVECKRQKRISDYSYRETEKSKVLIANVEKLLVRHNLLLEITFHVELVSLPDMYLHDILAQAIPKFKRARKLISNDEVEILATFINIAKIKGHLSKFFVKYGSPQHFELIAGRPVDDINFTSGEVGSYVHVGDGEANNVFISDLTNAYGVFCYCDADEALHAKARDVRNQINDALKQFGPDSDSIIHIGMETFDGPQVEKARSEKIIRTMREVDSGLNKLGWIYYHYFQSYARADGSWYYDETLSMATAFVSPDRPPLENPFLILPEDMVSIRDASHWDLDQP